MTESEYLFKQYCLQKNINYQRIAEEEGKSPDFWVDLGDNKILVEVKQLDPNAEERHVLNIPADEFSGENVYHWGMPGERIRKKITSGLSQLRIFAKRLHPTLLVIFDNIKRDGIQMWPELTDENAVKVAMYGIETALISPEVAPERGANIIHRWHGARRRLTTEHNTTLSAIGILQKHNDLISLRVYHNYYAANPLSPETLSSVGIPQFALESEPIGCFPDWKAIRIT
ncbi:MAG TPA: hypothetical protein VMX13_01575 [Sedimentisphaerales bacterium]|nr:hypothetical protein [Sedimentisphaerales bacterium]